MKHSISVQVRPWEAARLATACGNNGGGRVYYDVELGALRTVTRTAPLSTPISRPQPPIVRVSRPSFHRVSPGMRSIHPRKCHWRGAQPSRVLGALRLRHHVPQILVYITESATRRFRLRSVVSTVPH